MHRSILKFLALVLLAYRAVADEATTSVFGTSETSTPPIEKHHIDTPSPLTQFMHYFGHLDQFQLYPNFMTSMPVDIAEGPESYTLHVDLPGVNKDDLIITVDPEQHEMQISALKQTSKELIEKRFKRIERYTGHMTRTLFLPDKAGLENLTAKFNTGVLEISIPKVTPAPETKRHEVPIHSE